MTYLFNLAYSNSLYCSQLTQIHLSRNLRFVSSDAEFSREEEDLKEELTRKLINRKLSGPTVEIMEAMDPGKLPLRELPPGTTASLFLMYLAWCKAGSMQNPCGKSTFYNVYNTWSTCLRFRRRSEHAMCVTCQTLKAAINNAVELASVWDINQKAGS